MHKTVIFLFGFLYATQILMAQQEFTVTIIYDRNQKDSLNLQNAIKTEIESLLSTKYKLNFNELSSNGNIIVSRKLIDEVYSNKDSDVLIGAGLLTSQILMERNNYPLPTIAAINIDNQFSDISDSEVITSSVHNFTYIQSPFSIEKDIDVLSQIADVKKIVVLVDPVFKEMDYSLTRYTSQYDHIDFQLVAINSDPQVTLDSIKNDVNAVYVLSTLVYNTESQSRALFEGIAEKKILCLSLLDYPMLDFGAYAAFSSKSNILKIPRRIAINVSKIAEGQDPKDFPVQMEVFTRQLIINMEAVNKTGIYPRWQVLDNATLINISNIEDGRKLTLKSAIAEGLENNLVYQISQKQEDIVKKDVNLARSNYLPQLEASTMGLFLDENTVSSSFGTKGDFNWSAGASFSQLILSEPALANISIQKLLSESQQQAVREAELDVVLDVITAFFNYQQVQSVVKMLNDNVDVKQQNLDIAINKEKVGYSGESDVFRWETELALAKADLNEAMTQLKAVQFQLNQTLNRPVNEKFMIEQMSSDDSLVRMFDQRFVHLIDNPGMVETLSDFLVREALINLPENKQIELALQAQERFLKSNKRAHYIPTIALAANYDYPISTVNPDEPLPIPGMDISPEPTWNVAFVASIPIFTGGYNHNQKQKSQIELSQLQDQQKDIQNKLELQVRANLENVVTSFRNLQLNDLAAQSAEKNVVIVQDLYNQGLISITSLIDAQNAFLSAEINASNAVYQFIIDFFVLERSVGGYMTLATEEQRSEFMGRFLQYQISVNN
jgi:outer membrane protein TolC